ncbi:MFS transporter [Nonomuraea sp. NPDC048892]|uniref:MFS transporter n=1 Tax=Nonomuraea sp. NPDC048892 TaxID=3154624 RepID=UPI0033D6B20B
MTSDGPGGLPHRRLLGLPGVAAQAVLGFLAQLTQQVAPVGLVLVAQRATGSLALAGLTAAAFSLGAGMGRPVLGRLMDRHGPRPVLATTALLHVAALLALVGYAQPDRPQWPMVALAWIIGVALPPISVSMRLEWGRRTPAEGRTAAYSLVFLVQELAMLTGPLLFGLLIAVASASLALGTVAAAAGAGTLAFSLALRSGSYAGSRGRGRVFADRRMFVLLPVVLLLGGFIGAVQVGVPALATAREVPAATGPLVAALSVGGIAGAIAYGSRRWRSGIPARLAALMLALGLPLTPLALFDALPSFSGPSLSTPSTSGPPIPGPLASASLAPEPPSSESLWWMAVFWAALFLAGLALTPALTTSSLLVDEYAPHAQAEAFGWVSTAIGTGGAAGAAVAGVAGDRFGPAAPFLTAAIFALAGAALALALLRRPRTPSPGRP